MPYALELLLDPATTRAVEALWNHLGDNRKSQHRAGAPELPHLSLLVAESLDLSETAVFCSSVVWPIPCGLQLGPIREFVAPGYVFYLAVEEVPELRAFHRRIFHGLSQNAKGFWPLYAPNAWVPHVTLCQENRVSQELLRELEARGPVSTAQPTEFLVVEFDRVQRHERLRIPIRPMLPEEISQEEMVWQRFDQDLAHGAYFDAHEVLEDLWPRDHDPRRQAAIWVAAAFVHWSRGTLSGARKLFLKLDRDAAHRPDPLMPLIDYWIGALDQNLPNPGITPTDRDTLVRWARYGL